MGYFDALTGSSFKTTPNGRRLFFPWGTLGRGYVIGSERDYERLRSQIKIYFIIGMALIVGTVVLHRSLAALLVTALCLFYFAWTRYLLRRLQPSDERLSLRESMTTQAREQSPITLWLLEIGAIAFVAAGFLIIAFDPDKWLIAMAAIVVFGLCAAASMVMLVLQRRA